MRAMHIRNELVVDFIEDFFHFIAGFNGFPCCDAVYEVLQEIEKNSQIYIELFTELDVNFK